MDLTLDNISKSFDGTQVVDQVSLNIPQGEFLALLGPSGCGKTTILRMIAGFEGLTAGQIRMGDCLFADGASGYSLAPEERHLAMVFQSYALWPHMNVYDNIAYPLKIHGIKGEEQRKRVNHVLEQTGLDMYAQRMPKALSGGQQQRVALARSLVTRPNIILLDEPLANLDRHLRASMQETFRSFNRDSGISFVYVTHDQHEAMAMADRIAVLASGKLLQAAAPQEIYARPDNAWVAGFIGEGSIVAVSSQQRGIYLQAQAAYEALAIASEASNAQGLVRPEEVSINSEGLPAEVRQCRFLGERYLCTLRLASGAQLRLYTARRHDIGEKLHCCVKSLWVLPE